MSSSIYPILFLIVLASGRVAREFAEDVENIFFLRRVTCILVISVTLLLGVLKIVFSLDGIFVLVFEAIDAVGLGVYGEIGREAIKRKQEQEGN